jgi:hypothetical protein
MRNPNLTQRQQRHRQNPTVSVSSGDLNYLWTNNLKLYQSEFNN